MGWLEYEEHDVHCEEKPPKWWELLLGFLFIMLAARGCASMGNESKGGSNGNGVQSSR